MEAPNGPLTGNISLYPEESSYIIYIIESNFYARNGHTGKIDYSGRNASNIFQSCIDALKNGGRILVKQGTYDLPIGLTIINGGTVIEGESQSVTLQPYGNVPNLITFQNNSSRKWVGLKNIRLYRNNQPLTNFINIANKVGRVFFDHVSIDGMNNGYAIYYSAVADVCNISKCAFLECRTGIYMPNGGGLLKVHQTDISGSLEYAVNMKWTDGVNFVDCNLDQNNNFELIKLEGNKHTKFIGGRMVLANREAIHTYGGEEDLLVMGVDIHDCSKAEAGIYSAIKLNGNTAQTKILGCNIDGGASNYHKYGIEIGATVTDTKISNNGISRYRAGAITNRGIRTISDIPL